MNTKDKRKLARLLYEAATMLELGYEFIHRSLPGDPGYSGYTASFYQAAHDLRNESDRILGLE